MIQENLRAAAAFYRRAPNARDFPGFLLTILCFHIVCHQPIPLVTADFLIEILPWYPCDTFGNIFRYAFQQYSVDDAVVLLAAKKAIQSHDPDLQRAWLIAIGQYACRFGLRSDEQGMLAILNCLDQQMGMLSNSPHPGVLKVLPWVHEVVKLCLESCNRK